MSYFVWNKIDHAVVRGNDRKEKDYGTLARSLTVRAQPAPLSVHAVTFRSRKAAFLAPSSELASVLAVAQQRPRFSRHEVTFRSRKAAFVEAIASLPESKAT
ncbi:hypothetical protein ACRN97_06500 [Shewanella baltica]|uniref:hypothetical protein n=1 Tax=Shewanella TaxID=22 RepID=UPI001BBF6F92|nr:hypothetical protein [Shewanella morhuae]GIU08449.1 hypothetical protein TUM4641_22470 [Shewanella morhuae]